MARRSHGSSAKPCGSRRMARTPRAAAPAPAWRWRSRMSRHRCRRARQPRNPDRRHPCQHHRRPHPGRVEGRSPPRRRSSERGGDPLCRYSDGARASGRNAQPFRPPRTQRFQSHCLGKHPDGSDAWVVTRCEFPFFSRHGPRGFGAGAAASLLWTVHLTASKTVQFEDGGDPQITRNTPDDPDGKGLQPCWLSVSPTRESRRYVSTWLATRFGPLSCAGQG